MYIDYWNIAISVKKRIKIFHCLNYSISEETYIDSVNIAILVKKYECTEKYQPLLLKCNPLNVQHANTATDSSAAETLIFR